LQKIEVTQVTGRPELTAPITPENPNLSPPALRSGSQLMQGYIVTTRPGDQVTLKLPFPPDAEMQVTISNATSLRIAQYSKDAAGKVKLRLHLSNPGRLDVSVTNSGPAPLDYEIITPTASIKTIKTRYLVQVDAQGVTTVAATEGEVLLTPVSAALAPVTLRAGQQAQVSPEKVSPQPVSLQPVAPPPTGNTGDDTWIVTGGTGDIEITPQHRSPAAAQAHYDKGSEYYDNGLWAQAESEYRQALKLDPKFDECWKMLGDASSHQNKWAEAEKAYREATRLKPGEGYYHAQLASALLKLGRRDEAITAARKAIQLGLEDHEVFDELGLTASRKAG
jgi:hypothetical protein